VTLAGIPDVRPRYDTPRLYILGIGGDRVGHLLSSEKIIKYDFPTIAEKSFNFY
jgi:hypothetical protein